MDRSPGGKLRRIGTLAAINRAPGLESRDRATEATGDDAISADVVKQSVSALQDQIVRMRGGTAQMTDSDRALVETARSAGGKLATDGAGANLSASEEMALEAIAVADGSRPALLLHDDTIDPNDRTIGDWGRKLRDFGGALKAASQSVGRINMRGRHIGTGWMIRPGCVVTNRHVAQVVSKDPKQVHLNLDSDHGPTICFGHQFNETAPLPQHPIEAILFAGEEYVDPYRSDMARLDLAILKIGAGPVQLPDPLPSSLLPLDQTVVATDIFVLGYPGPAAGSSLPNSVLMDLLGPQAGLKRLSPGEIALEVGKIASDSKSRTFVHDATTLGGSSGSAILAFDKVGRPLTLGLHFGGYEVKYGPGGVVEYRGRNFAHSFAAMDDVMADVNRAVAAELSRA
ncbi:serine protease [Bradyrhizobium sp. CCGB01]|uniref:trypsin-like serine peptidase n=1 Tax=Bradyrhizobium sp. CCGB01 TaxID=2949634 RepID=UPI0020B18361|nr:serine protease [Bradyrhizobium sp. CCGB01]MCP3404464.1 serine protease [Bradyrhizobium sp. CCGB01]